MRSSDWSSDVCSSDLDERIWGERIEDRGSQITFSGLGQAAPLKEKEAWDPDRKKRTALQATLRATLPDLSINLGGTTSIDVTRAGVDKGYGLKRLSAESGVPLDGMLFIGDAIFPGRSEEHTSELQSLMRISYAVFCLKKKKQENTQTYNKINNEH